MIADWYARSRFGVCVSVCVSWRIPKQVPAGCGKTEFFESYGLQPVWKWLKFRLALPAEAMLFATRSALLRGLLRLAYPPKVVRG
jgi:hypothetical protein